MEPKAIVMAFIDLALDFIRLIGYADIADEIANKIVMPL